MDDISGKPEHEGPVSAVAIVEREMAESPDAKWERADSKGQTV